MTKMYPRRVSPQTVSTQASHARLKARKHKRLPPWVDAAQLKAVYQARADQEAATGVQLCVRHIVPLHNWKVSGLHVPANLAIVPEGAPEPEQWPDMP